jgi:AcrR family transcriptional regulator
MAKERNANLPQALILAGIEEINTYGANDFSVRRVAAACNVSTAAPYKHFKDKKELIGAIIDYVNEQWAVVQDEVLARCPEDPRSQMVEIAVAYTKFLMEKPYYRQTLMLKNAEFDNLYHRKRGEINSRTQQIMARIKDVYGLSDDVWARKALMVRSLLFGAVFMFDSGEFTYNETSLEHIRYLVNREFEIL